MQEPQKQQTHRDEQQRKYSVKIAINFQRKDQKRAIIEERRRRTKTQIN